MADILIFAGTTEGRKLVESICKSEVRDHRFFVSVATEYGRSLLPQDVPHVSFLSQRLSPEEMSALMQKESISIVIDATHPYAVEVTGNIREACSAVGADYVRLVRDSSRIEEDVVVVQDSVQAAEYLKKTHGDILLTIGSKELSAFTALKERVYPRILPTPEMVKKAVDLGFSGANLICMQGPFTEELNLAMIKQTGASYLVTKESGKAGGFEEKAAAARTAGAKLIIIGRPMQEQGISLDQAMTLCGIEPAAAEGHRWFPMFMDIRDKKVVVVGAGKIAQRRIRGLLNFACSLTVVAPLVQEWVEEQADKGRLVLWKRDFEERDLDEADIVLAATNSRGLNQTIGNLCKDKDIYVNVADDKNSCDFYFPGLVIKDELIIGLTAEGKNHALAVSGKKKIIQALEGEI